jgi:hypothetical protein
MTGRRKNRFNCDFRDNEDLPVIDFLEANYSQDEFNMLEVGSGLCRFLDKIKKLYPKIDVIGIEINPELVHFAINSGHNVINQDFLKNSFLSDSFDIVHCSHIIEHFKYPEITIVIDELLRVTKKNGICIIRSPLMWKNFYNDIDHIRPYPPESVMGYLNNCQQQKKGIYTVIVEKIWYRTGSIQIKINENRSRVIVFRIIQILISKFVSVINGILQYSWDLYRFPCTKPNGYVMILRKN